MNIYMMRDFEGPMQTVNISQSITRNRDVFDIARGLNMLGCISWNQDTIVPIVPQITVSTPEIGLLKRFISECKRVNILPK